MMEENLPVHWGSLINLELKPDMDQIITEYRDEKTTLQKNNIQWTFS